MRNLKLILALALTCAAFGPRATAQSQVYDDLTVRGKVVYSDQVTTSSDADNSPGTAANVADGTRSDWTTPANAASSNDTYTTQSLAGSSRGDTLRLTNFGISIPSGAVVEGVTVAVERKASAETRAYDYRLQLVKAGTATGNVKKNTESWPTSDATISYGTDEDRWGVGLSEADVEASTFGVDVQVVNASSNAVTVYVDHVKLTVYYRTQNGDTAYYQGIKSGGDLSVGLGSTPGADDSIVVNKTTGVVTFPNGVSGVSADLADPLSLGTFNATTALQTGGVTRINSTGVGTFAAGTTINGGTAWHSGNDGAGSGLDADLLDGYGSDDFATTATDALKLPLAAGSGSALSGTLWIQNSSGSWAAPSGSNSHLALRSATASTDGVNIRASGPSPYATLSIYPEGNNRWSMVRVFPHGVFTSAAGFRPQSGYEVFGSDYAADSANYQVGGLFHDGSNVLINSKDVGTYGGHSPITFIFDDQWRAMKILPNGFTTISGYNLSTNEIPFKVEKYATATGVSGTPNYGTTTATTTLFSVDAEGDVTATSYAGTWAGSKIGSSYLPSIPIMPADDVQLYVRMRGNDAAGLANVITGTNATSVNGTPAAASVITDSNGRSSVGKCVTLDGTDDWISYGDNFDQGTGDFSVAFWFKCTLSATAQFIDKRSGLYTGYALAIGSSGALRMEMGTGSGTSDTSIGSGYDDGTWHHAVFSFDRDANLLSYVDGALVDTTNISGASAQDLSNTDAFYVGRSRDNLAPYPGQMDELLVFTRALTADEARRLYLNGTIVAD